MITTEHMHTLARIEAKLDLLLARLPADPTATDDPSTLPGYQVHAVTRIEHYISSRGNPTWKAFTQDGEIIYLRQSHQTMLKEAGLWDQLNEMQIGDDGDESTPIIW